MQTVMCTSQSIKFEWSNFLLWDYCCVDQERKMMEGSLTDLQLRLTELQQEKVAVEDRLGSQLAQLNEKFLSEQRSQEKQEFSLNRQLTATISKNIILLVCHLMCGELFAANVEQMKAELDRERHMKEEV